MNVADGTRETPAYKEHEACRSAVTLFRFATERDFTVSYRQWLPSSSILIMGEDKFRSISLQRLAMNEV